MATAKARQDRREGRDPFPYANRISGGAVLGFFVHAESECRKKGIAV
jgi:hypothetical protein